MTIGRRRLHGGSGRRRLCWSVCPGAAGVLLVLCGLLASGRLVAQDVTEVALKAAFIYNFAKFTDWPPQVLPPAARLTACVVGDEAVGEALERAVRGRQAGGHGIEVSLLKPGADAALKTCHLVYVSGVSADRAAQVAAALRTTPVLTISDIDPFARDGGIAQFFVENGKMRFTINLAAARRAGLQLSSQLLSLAVLVDQAGPLADSSTPRFPSGTH